MYLELGATAIIYCSVSITRALHDHVMAMQLQYGHATS